MEWTVVVAIAIVIFTVIVAFAMLNERINWLQQELTRQSYQVNLMTHWHSNATEHTVAISRNTVEGMRRVREMAHPLSDRISQRDGRPT